ncbi:MAG: tryptophan--tRNA ligase [Saprospiraceae bacterium]|nr:tryptophan--tRNA ligase [Saprospiraceae bacterium]
MKKRILSCIQPTGDMHLGNYFGAVKNWVDLQADYECFYGVVDYHAMTMPYDPKKLKNNVWDLIFNLIGAGVNIENLFIQSLVPEHAELSWIFNCFTPFGRLGQMTQFKDKSNQSSEKSEGFISAGLFTYPILQAADILIYNADYVPVGKDQEQHLELTRTIAQRFNNQAQKEYFTIPECLFTETPKIMSTADPMRKMSKSAGEKHFISLFADEARIRKQIRSAVTDSGDTPEGEMSAGVENLFEILKACGADDAYKAMMNNHESGALRYAEFKDVVADEVVKLCGVFKERKTEALANKKDIKYKIKQSSAEIRKTAQQTLKEVKELAGLGNVKF